MNFIKHLKPVILLLSFTFFMTSCSNEMETESIESSLISVKLKGTPSQLSALNVDVVGVQFKVLEDETNPNAWINLNTINTGMHDLTDFANDRAITLVDFVEIPSEYIYNIKLQLGEQTYIRSNGVEHILDLNSDIQNATVNIVEKQLQKNTLYEFIIEFEIDKSIYFTTAGDVTIDPKINTLIRQMSLH